MKIATYLCLLFFTAIACQPTTSENSNASASKNTLASSNSSPSSDLPTDCQKELRDSKGNIISYQLKSDCAESYIQDFQNYTDDVNAYLQTNAATTFPESGRKLIFGANVDLAELRRVLEWSELNNPNDSLFLMMGIVQPMDSTEIIFALKTTPVIGQGASWKYFDFTRPCPTGCPDL